MTNAAQARANVPATQVGASVRVLPHPPDSSLAEFEHIYRRNVDVVMAYFARRCSEPQTVADLTSETFVRAAGSFGGFDPRRGSARAWLFGIAGHVYARHCARAADARDAAVRLQEHRALDDDEIEELAARIDAERAGRELIERFSQLPEGERAALELVDLSELTPKEAAVALGVSRIVLRKRLSRARARLRNEASASGAGPLRKEHLTNE